MLVKVQCHLMSDVIYNLAGSVAPAQKSFFIGSFEFNSPIMRRSKRNLHPIREELPRRCYNTWGFIPHPDSLYNVI